MSKKITQLIISHPLKIFLTTIGIIILLIVGVLKMEMDFTYRVWFSENDPDLKVFDEFESKFGNDDEIIVLLHNPDGIFNKNTIQDIMSLTEDFRNISDIIRVDSLTNFERIYGVGKSMTVEPLFLLEEKDTLTNELILKKKKIALEDPMLPNYLISRDAKTAILIGKLRPGFDNPPNYAAILEDTRNMVDRYNGENRYVFHIAGAPAIDQAFSEVTNKDIEGLFPFLMLTIIITLIISFKRISGFIFPFFVMLLSIPTIFGIAGWLGIRFNALTGAIPNIILGISIASVVHLLTTFFQNLNSGNTKIDSIRSTFEKNIRPTFLTSLSTAIGFFSLSISDIIPLANLGLLSGIGVMIVWVFTIFLMGPLMIWIPFKIKKTEQSEIGTFVKKYVNYLDRFSLVPILLFILLAVVMLFYSSKNYVDSNPFEAFTDDVPIKQADNFMKKHIGGSMGIEVVVDSGEAEGIKDPAFLNKVEKLQSWIDELPYVTKTNSILDVLKSTNQALNGNDLKEYKINQNKASISEQIFLYALSLPQGKDLNHLIIVKCD